MISDLYVHSASSALALRVGVLLDDTVLMRVFADILRDIHRSDFARLELVIFNGPGSPAPPPKRTVPDQRWYPAKDDPVAPEDCTALLAGVPVLDVTPITTRFVHRVPEGAPRAVRAAHLDVLLRFGFNILRGEILTAARYGVWSFHHGDSDLYRGGPAHFWEMYEGNPFSGVVLLVLTEQLNGGHVLAKALFAT